jgi:hypothetical protein
MHVSRRLAASTATEMPIEIDPPVVGPRFDGSSPSAVANLDRMSFAPVVFPVCVIGGIGPSPVPSTPTFISKCLLDRALFHCLSPYRVIFLQKNR